MDEHIILSEGKFIYAKQDSLHYAVQDIKYWVNKMNWYSGREIFDYFEGKTNIATTINLIKQHTRNYCKRQLTFLKTINNVELLTLSEADTKIRSFLND